MIWLYRGLVGLSILLIMIWTSGVITTLITRFFNPLKKLSKEEKVIYLTFDDGMNTHFTPKLLDLLKKENIQASFFMLTSTIDGNEDILHRMKNEGHVIGLHGYHHDNQILQLPHMLIRDTKKSLKLFEKQGITVHHSRAPWGHLSLVGYILNKIYNIKPIFWNVIVQDWEKDTTPEILIEKLMRKVQGTSVICMHDGRGKNDAPLKTIKALETCIPKWKEEGYRFETVEKIN